MIKIGEEDFLCTNCNVRVERLTAEGYRYFLIEHDCIDEYMDYELTCEEQQIKNIIE